MQDRHPIFDNGYVDTNPLYNDHLWNLPLVNMLIPCIQKQHHNSLSMHTIGHQP